MAVANWDAIGVDDLRAATGVKWSSPDDGFGASVAEMDFPIADPIRDAFRAIGDGGYIGYTSQRVMDNLRAALVRWYERTSGWSPPVEGIFTTEDVNHAMLTTIRHFSPPGSKVIVPTPAYPAFLMFPGLDNREIIQVPMLDDGERFVDDLDGIARAFEQGGHTLILCNPHNPLGRVYERGELEAIADVVARYNGRVFSDEIFAALTLDGRTHIPYASVSEETARHTITATSCSKGWNVAGVGSAQIVLTNPDDLAAWNAGVGMHVVSGCTVGALVCTAAYSAGDDWVAEVRAYLEGNRAVIDELLASHLPGATWHAPEGTYLAWIDFSACGLPDDLGAFFREHAGVTANDGARNGDAGRGAIRFNFAMPRPLLRTALEQMGEAMASVANR